MEKKGPNRNAVHFTPTAELIRFNKESKILLAYAREDWIEQGMQRMVKSRIPRGYVGKLRVVK